MCVRVCVSMLMCVCVHAHVHVCVYVFRWVFPYEVNFQASAPLRGLWIT